MSNLARYFKTRGKVVAGYDRAKSALTEELEAEGIAVHYTDDVAAIPVEFLKNDTTLVVRTPAVPEDQSELRFFHKNGYKVLKRAQVLGEVSVNSRSLCIAGTHGKTTTTTMTAHLLKTIQYRLQCLSWRYFKQLQHQFVVERS